MAFDGRAFRQIRPEDARLRKITALLPLATGRILLGTEKSGVSASTTINRKDFGISYNKAMDNGGVMLGEEIPINIEIEMAKQPKVAEVK